MKKFHYGKLGVICPENTSMESALKTFLSVLFRLGTANENYDDRFVATQQMAIIEEGKKLTHIMIPKRHCMTFQKDYKSMLNIIAILAETKMITGVSLSNHLPGLST